jgi:hypothetical protein
MVSVVFRFVTSLGKLVQDLVTVEFLLYGGRVFGLVTHLLDSHRLQTFAGGLCTLCFKDYDVSVARLLLSHFSLLFPPEH